MKKVSAKSQFVSNLFLVKKKDRGNRPVINLKNLNQYIPHHHFKMESPQSLRDILKQGDFICKLDLKDAYFCITLAEELKKFVRCYWEGELYQFLCLCFGLAPVPYIFIKSLKIPIAFLRRIGTLIIIYLYDMLLRTAQNVQMYRDTVILLLQDLGFVINLKQSVRTTSQEMEFLGMVINSKEMTIFLPEEKLQKVKLQCLDLYQSPQVSILQLTKVLGHLMSTIQAVLPAGLNSHFLQQQQIQALKEKKSYLANITLNSDSKQELLCWIKNLEIFNGASHLKQVPQVVLQTDASLTGWVAALQGKSIGGTWSIEERKWHINELELLAVKLALQTLLKSQNFTSVHIQMDNIVALTYLKKMGGNKESGNDYPVKRDLGDVNFKTNHD